MDPRIYYMISKNCGGIIFLRYMFFSNFMFNSSIYKLYKAFLWTSWRLNVGRNRQQDKTCFLKYCVVILLRIIHSFSRYDIFVFQLFFQFVSWEGHIWRMPQKLRGPGTLEVKTWFQKICAVLLLMTIPNFSTILHFDFPVFDFFSLHSNVYTYSNSYNFYREDKIY